MEYIVSNIIYDIDETNVDIKDLPTELLIKIPECIGDDNYDINEYLSDEISNLTGFTHKGYNVEPELNY